MNKNGGSKQSNRPIQYKCECREDDCNCDAVIESKEVPDKIPYCCDVPIKRSI